MKYKTTILYTSILVLMYLYACNEEEKITPPVTASFSNAASNVGIEDTNLEITLVLSEATTQDEEVVLDVTESGSILYGEDKDYYTAPAIENNQLALSIPSGSNSVSFMVYKNADMNLEQEKTVSFSIQGLSNALTKGDNTATKVLFTQNPALAGGTLEANMGGEEEPNQVFVDLSTGKSTITHRWAWDLGFYTTSGEFRVIVNTGGHVMARALETTDLNAVSETDIDGFDTEMQIGFTSSAAALAWVDGEDGDLSKTAIKEIAEGETENPVYVIRRSATNTDGNAQTEWLKIRILRNGEGYTLHYAAINDTSFKTLDISKDDVYNFTFFHFDNGLVNIEPKKNNWDICFTQYVVNIGIPYGFKDYIIHNRNQVEVAQLMESEAVMYEDFDANDLENVTYDSPINSIGSNWRKGGGPGAQPEIYDDRFYVLKDTEGNIYKLKFTRLYSKTQERGYPEFIYEKIQ